MSATRNGFRTLVMGRFWPRVVGAMSLDVPGRAQVFHASKSGTREIQFSPKNGTVEGGEYRRQLIVGQNDRPPALGLRSAPTWFMLAVCSTSFVHPEAHGLESRAITGCTSPNVQTRGMVSIEECTLAVTNPSQHSKAQYTAILKLQSKI